LTKFGELLDNLDSLQSDDGGSNSKYGVCIICFCECVDCLFRYVFD